LDERSKPTFDRKMENQQNGIVKTTLDLPNELVREVKLRAVNEGKKLKDVIAELLTQGLGHSSQPPMGVTPRRGTIEIPLFRSSSNAPAGRMTLEQLVAAEHETLTRDDLERPNTPA